MQFLYLVSSATNLTHMKAEIPVTPYVYKYLSQEFGKGPLDLTQSHRHQLRLAFEHLRLGAEFVPKQSRIPFTVVLDLGDDHMLRRLYRMNEPMLRAGTYFNSQFMERMYHYVSDQEDLANIHGLSKSEWNREMSLRCFLEKYGITEADYSYDAASRQLRRLIRPKKGYNPRKNLKDYLDRKYQFQPARDPKVRWVSGYKEFSEPGLLFSQEEDMVRLCSMIEEAGVYRIHFAAYSRWHKDLVGKTLRVPDDIVKKGKLHEYVDAVCRIINQYLLDGYTIA